MTFGEKIKALRLERGMTLEQVGDVVGVGKSTVRKWESGQIANMRRDKIALLAQALGVTPGYLMGWETLNEVHADTIATLEKRLETMIAKQALDQSLPSNVQPISELHRQSIPLIGKVAAGQPIMAETDYETFVTSPVECDAALEVEGESMVPTYQPGDIVYIKHQRTVRDGQVAVVLLDDSATLKHVYREKDGLTLVSDNKDYSPIHVTDAEYDYVAIYGVPVGYTRIYKPSIEGKIKKGL